VIPLGEPLADEELLAAARHERALIVSAVRAAGMLGNRAGRSGVAYAANPFDPETEAEQHSEWCASFDRARRKAAAAGGGERRSRPAHARLPYRDD
jgi:hypothetical protein